MGYCGLPLRSPPQTVAAKLPRAPEPADAPELLNRALSPPQQLVPRRLRAGNLPPIDQHRLTSVKPKRCDPQSFTCGQSRHRPDCHPREIILAIPPRLDLLIPTLQIHHPNHWRCSGGRWVRSLALEPCKPISCSLLHFVRDLAIVAGHPPRHQASPLSVAAQPVHRSAPVGSNGSVPHDRQALLNPGRSISTSLLACSAATFIASSSAWSGV